MLDGVNRWVSKAYSTTVSAYKGPNGNGLLDGRITRNGADTYGGTATEVVPVTVLHHNDPHGRLLPSGSAPGYTNLATLIKQERQHNPNRTILLNAGDTIQGDAMAAYYKAAFTGLAPDGASLPISLTVNPILKAMNAMTYTAMTLGNHEFNYGSTVFVGTLRQATFPLLQANVYDTPWPHNTYLPLIAKGGGTIVARPSTVLLPLPGIYGLRWVNLVGPERLAAWPGRQYRCRHPGHWQPSHPEL
jgi:2',3'-cyclic-nucleotide 2'-phosphodiesterase (5'-nucleotidase family)